MAHNDLPKVIDAAHLEGLLGCDDLLVVNVGKTDNYLMGHIPGAVHVPQGALVGAPGTGQLPPLPALGALLKAMGLHAAARVVAYDDQGGTRACRLLWTLEAVGHHRWALLDGGWHAWVNEGRATEVGQVEGRPGEFEVALNTAVMADKDYILGTLADPDVIILDARSAAEYHGLRSPASRCGHIPGAINLNWLDTLDQDRQLRFKPRAELQRMLASRGIHADQEIIAHCQTHHRSSHSFVMLRHLGFNAVRGYPGSWAEWGNDPALPVE